MDSIKFLRENAAFWSRLGFGYDTVYPGEADARFLYDDNLERFGEYHRAFTKAGVNIHTLVLDLGWRDVDEYDYTVVDKVLEELFRGGENIYFIPRVKLNAPVGWCRENPEELFEYYGGPETAEEIRAMVGTPMQDLLGYEAPNGYYVLDAKLKDPRPNVGGMIARQSFSSQKWKKDAGVALIKLIDHLDNTPYKDRILGYHLGFGTSGENILWGRISERYGDYGITNKTEFLK